MLHTVKNIVFAQLVYTRLISHKRFSGNCGHDVSEIERDIGENNGQKAGFFIPPLHSMPPLRGVSVGLLSPPLV